MKEQKITTEIGIKETAITTATATASPIAMTWDRKLCLPPTTEPKIDLSVPFVPFHSHATSDCWELDKNKSKRPNN